MTNLRRSAMWLTVFISIAALCSLIIVTALRTPVRGAVSTFSATFDDVSGLFAGNDVRMSGVQVGKVSSVSLDGGRANVEFTVTTDDRLFTDTTAAIRYQNLLGQRYLELVQSSHPGDLLAPGAHIPVERTISSFDVAKLFNGFRPLFHNLDPAQLNKFGDNLLKLIQGDGSGIGPVLRDLDSISQFASDKQAVIVTLIRNLGEISHDIGGKSSQIGAFIGELNNILQTFTGNIDALMASFDHLNPPLSAAVGLLEQLQGSYDAGYGPIDGLIRRTVPQTAQIVEALSLMPTLIDEMNSVQQATPVFTCTGGTIDLPGIGQVSFARQNLVLCR